MQRIEGMFDQAMLQRIADTCGTHLMRRMARCEHGRTRQQACPRCEMGDVFDTHAFATIPPVADDPHGNPLVGVSDDGLDVIYIPYREQYKINRSFAQFTEAERIALQRAT